MCRALLAAVLLALSGPAMPATADEPVAVERDARAETRDRLLERLKTAPTEAEGRAAEDAVWKFWLEAPDPQAQDVLDGAIDRIRWHDHTGALEPLNWLVEEYPDYAEGWNQRAIVHFLRGEYEQSLADIEEVLEREPAHFGALAGKALILMQQGRTAEAQLALVEAVKVHPWLKERSLLRPGEKL